MTRSVATTMAIGAVFLVLLLRSGWAAVRAKRAGNWPKATATIISARLEVMELDDKTDIMLPCFAFSYVAAGGNYSGRFSLFTNGEEEGEALARKMVKRELQISVRSQAPFNLVYPGQEA